MKHFLFLKTTPIQIKNKMLNVAQNTRSEAMLLEQSMKNPQQAVIIIEVMIIGNILKSTNFSTVQWVICAKDCLLKPKKRKFIDIPSQKLLFLSEPSPCQPSALVFPTSPSPFSIKPTGHTIINISIHKKNSNSWNNLTKN